MNVTQQQQQQQQPQRASGGGAPYYIGCGISLISKSGIRYEGTLYAIDPTASTVALQNVRSFGSEGRRKEGQIPPSNNVYEYIIFRGSDIKHLEVCEPPRQTTTQQPPNDPAIINVQQGHSAQNMGYPKQPNMFYPPQAMNMYHPSYYNNPYAMYNQYYPYGPNPQAGNPNLPRGPQQGFPPNPNDLPQGSGPENGEETDKKEQNGEDEVNGESNEDSEKTENNETAGDGEENANETEKSNEGLSGTSGDGSSSVVTTGSAGSAGSVPSTSVKRDEISKDNSNANVNNNSYGYANKERREHRDESGRSQGYQRGGREGDYQRREGDYQRRDGDYQRRETDYQRREGGDYQRREGGDYQRRGSSKNVRGQNRNVYRGSNGRGTALRKPGGRGEKISEFDFEKSHTLFDFGQFKEELKQSGVPMGSAPPTEVDEGSDGEEPAPPAVNVTKAYNKNESFFDNLSSDSGEGKTRTSFAEQRKVDVETFGQVHLGDRGRRRFPQKRGQSQNYANNTNTTGGGGRGRGGHTGGGRGGYAGSGAGNHGSGQGNTKKVFVPVNSSNGNTKNTSRDK